MNTTHIHHEKLVIAIDLDNTVFDTSRFVEVVLQEVNAQSLLDSAELSVVRRMELQLRGRSFDLLGHLREIDAMPALDSLIAHADALVYTGVSELIAHMADLNLYTIILTYGDAESQRCKLSLLEATIGKKLSFHITNTQNKAAWLTNNNHRILDERTGMTIEAGQCVLLDDKATNLESDDESIHGILIDNTADSTGIGGIPISAAREVVDRIVAQYADM